jgi:hypothetical protein
MEASRRPRRRTLRRAMAQWRERGLDPDRLWIARFGETWQL